MDKKLLTFLLVQACSSMAMADILDGVTINYDPLWIMSSGFSSSIEKKLDDNMSLESSFSYAPVIATINNEDISFSHRRYGVRVNFYSESEYRNTIYTSVGIGMRGIKPVDDSSIANYDGVHVPYYELAAGTQWELSENTKLKTGLGFIMGKTTIVDYNSVAGKVSTNTSDIVLMDSALEPQLSISHSF